MNQKKKTVLVLGIMVFVGVVAFLLYKRQPPPAPPPVKEGLRLLGVVPPEGKNKTLFTSTGIQFTFDGPLVLSTVKVSIEPKIEIITESARTSSAVLVVRPADGWEAGVPYTITIKKGLQTINNKELKEDFVYKIEFEYAENIIHY